MRFRHAFAEIVDDGGIEGAAATEVDLVDALFRAVFLVAVGQGFGGDAGDGGEAVLRGGALGDHALAEMFAPVVAEGFAASGFGNVVREVRPGEDFVEDFLVHFAGFGHFAVFVVLAGAFGEVADSAVYEDIAWSGVPIEGFFRCVFRQDRDVGNPADVLDGTVLGGVAGYQGVKGGEKGAALSAKGQVADTEVGDGGAAGFRGDDTDFGHVEMGSDDFTAGEHFGQGKMPDGLALAGDNVDVVLQAEAFLFGERF